MSALVIIEALERLIPPPAPEEAEGLRVSVEERGIYDPLTVADIDGERVLLDGHNRFRLAEELGIGFEVRVERSVSTLAEAERWMLEHQLTRRNLNAAQRVKLALALEAHYAAEAKDRQAQAGQEKLRQNSAEAPDDRKTAAKVAAAASVSRDTVRKAKAVFAEAAPEIVEAVERGEKSIHAAYTETRKPEAATPPMPRPSKRKLKTNEERQELVWKVLRSITNAHDALKGTKFADELLDGVVQRAEGLRTLNEFGPK